MSDPFEELRELGSGMPARPLPASEVRRRGDRMRWRRTAFQAAGAAVTVAVLGSGGLLVGENMTGTGPPPRPATQAPSPTVSATEPPGGWVSEIPEGFPLAVGLPAPDPVGNAPPWSTSVATDVAWSLLPCHEQDTGQSVFPSDARRTAASFIFAQVPARRHVRQLVVYRDGGSAAAAADQILAQARACGPEEAVPDAGELRWEVTAGPDLGGEQAWLVSGAEYGLATDARGTSRVLLAVVREGNALLVARLGDAASLPDPADLTEPAAAEWVGHVTTISAAMCVFAVQPCPPSADDITEDPPDAPLDEVASLTRIPDGFDLALGIPPDDADTKRTTSTRLNTRFAFDPCHRDGSHTTGPARTDFSEVVQTAPAGAYVHQLAVYPDARAADEAMAGIARDLEACSTYAYPDDISEDRWTRLDSDPTRFGTEGALVAVNHAYTDGIPTTLATHHIAVRVGNAVLVVTRDGEFGAAPDDSGTTAVDREQRDTAAGLVAQMCPFAGPDSELPAGPPRRRPSTRSAPMDWARSGSG